MYFFLNNDLRCSLDEKQNWHFGCYFVTNISWDMVGAFVTSVDNFGKLRGARGHCPLSLFSCCQWFFDVSVSILVRLRKNLNFCSIFKLFEILNEKKLIFEKFLEFEFVSKFNFKNSSFWFFNLNFKFLVFNFLNSISKF